ncbi:MAG: UbiA family prenyltransferase [Paracoccaceae bacterium]
MRDMKDSSAEGSGPLPVLAVDLDGTLVSSDMLFETFWAALALDWRTPFAALSALRQGRAALKAMLAGRVTIDVSRLPYTPQVIEYVRGWRAAGGRVALVTAADQSVAQRVADHLGLFDEVHGSDGTRNLKGAAKAALLVELYGARGFAYVGDAGADLAIWRDAARAITVDATPDLRRRVDAIDPKAEHLTTETPRGPAYVRALRPTQWLKNILVFAPLLAAHQFAMGTVLTGFVAFLSFSLVASAVYVLNDLLDLAADRAHPRKRARPFASGAIPISHGAIMAPGLLLGGLALALPLGWAFVAVMVTYFAATLAYSLVLKRRAILDITTLAALYTLRIVAGAAAVGLSISVWLLAFSIFFFFSLAAVKRQAELADLAQRGETEAPGRGYRVADLPVVAQMAMASGYVSVLVLVLYLDSPVVRNLYAQPSILWGICGVLLYWLSHIFMVTHRGRMHDDPIVYALRDVQSLVCVALMTGLAVAATLW